MPTVLRTDYAFSSTLGGSCSGADLCRDNMCAWPKRRIFSGAGQESITGSRASIQAIYERCGHLLRTVMPKIIWMKSPLWLPVCRQRPSDASGDDERLCQAPAFTVIHSDRSSGGSKWRAGFWQDVCSLQSFNNSHSSGYCLSALYTFFYCAAFGHINSIWPNCFLFFIYFFSLFYILLAIYLYAICINNHLYMHVTFVILAAYANAWLMKCALSCFNCIQLCIAQWHDAGWGYNQKLWDLSDKTLVCRLTQNFGASLNCSH